MTHQKILNYIFFFVVGGSSLFKQGQTVQYPGENSNLSAIDLSQQGGTKEDVIPTPALKSNLPT